MPTQTVSFEKLEENIVSNARKNADYRKRLIDDPRALLESQIGQPLPPGMKVTVLQESPTQAYIVLPYDAPKSGSQLSDEDLENVAGGGSKMNDVTCTNNAGSGGGAAAGAGMSMTTVVDVETKVI